MRVKIDLVLCCYIAKYGSDKDYSSLIKTSPRKKKKRLKKELANLVLKVAFERGQEIMDAKSITSDN